MDPYHVWLGIPPEEQPPNHYRLLGLALFESQPDVIATAADRQMGHLRTFQSGKHSALSQRLLNEVAAARVCLLTPAKKAAYDEPLRQQMAPTRAAAPTSQDSTPWADLSNELSSAAPTSRAARKRKRNFGPAIALVVAGVSVVVGSLAWNATRPTDRPNAQSAVSAKQGQQLTAQQREADTGPEPGAPVAVRKGTVPFSLNGTREEVAAVRSTGFSRNPGNGPPKGGTTNGAFPAARNRNENSDSPRVNEPPIPNPPDESAAAKTGHAAASPTVMSNPSEHLAVAKAETGPSTRPVFEKPTEAPEKMAMPSFDLSGDKPAGPPAEPPSLKKRLPVPDEDLQRKTAAQLAGIYGPGRTKADKIKLAYQLLQAAKASKEPNERYLLLRQGRELAAQGGDIALVLQAIEMTAAAFEIDLREEQEKSLLALADKAVDAEQIGSLYGASQRVIATALSEGRYKPAYDLANAVCRACQRLQGKEFRKRALAQRDWVRKYCRRQEERSEAEANLKADPDDAEAHLVLGRHYCGDDDWKKGLPHLAKGSDAELRQSAQRELASPTEPSEQIRLADAWWELGKARNGEAGAVLLLRAGYWYDRARGKLSSGLDRLRAEKRLEESVEVRSRRAAARRPFQTGKDAPQDLWNGLF
jgi:hypothetical protein